MKLKKLLAGALALVMTASLTILPAAAVTTFPDIQKHWAKTYIEEMTEAKLFKGFDDGTFRPDELINTSMALAVCARIAVSEEMMVQIGADRLAQVQSLFPKPADGKPWEYYWFYNEFAVCMELGIASYQELESIVQNGNLGKPLEKAEFARYLVRAMGLDSVAQGQDTFELNFTDAADIENELMPYVYLLNAYGVVEGTPDKKFLPDGYVNRAVSATMLSRAAGKMAEQKIVVELPAYTSYLWDAGTIVSVTPGDEGGSYLVLKNVFSGDKSIKIPSTAKVYQDNRQVEDSALKAGAYARACYNKDGVVESIRVIAAARQSDTSGVLTTLTKDEVVVNGKSCHINRFTEVEAGGKTGTAAIIDPLAGYETATVTTDILGNALVLRLAGGTRQMEGILNAVDTDLSGVTTLTLSGYDGSIQRLAVPASAVVTQTGGKETTLAAGYAGRHLTLRVKNDDLNAISTIEIDTAGTYTQGVLRGVDTKTTPATVVIANVDTNRQITYKVAATNTVSYQGKTAKLESLTNGSYVTAKLEGPMVAALSVWPGATYTEGELTRISYGNPTILDVTRADGAVVPFEVKTTALEDIDIVRSGVGADITQLRTGDTVTITVQYNVVTHIDAKPKSANVNGTVQSITFNTKGAEIALLLENGTTKTYLAGAATTVTQNGAVIPLKSVNFGAKLAMVTSGDQILSMEVTQNAVSSTKLTGTVYLVHSRTSITVLVSDGAGTSTPVMVTIPGGVTVNDSVLGGTISAGRLVAGDRLEIWGTYNKQEFEATTVVKVG
ncbi:MAG: S-layer homology domain-containing protein [Oscillospiraceae bacterium]